tara:strand:- start:76390 stop:76740 length:351 start_codon:yes stop_codon:yes gene_type:complete
MEKKIIQLIKAREFLAITAFKNSLPEIKGEYDFLFPSKGVENSNILLIKNVTEEFMNAFHSLVNNKTISFAPCNFWEVTHDGGEVYDLPIVKGKKSSYKKLHWLPLMIKKGEKFPE